MTGGCAAMDVARDVPLRKKSEMLATIRVSAAGKSIVATRMKNFGLPGNVSVDILDGNLGQVLTAASSICINIHRDEYLFGRHRRGDGIFGPRGGSHTRPPSVREGDGPVCIEE